MSNAIRALSSLLSTFVGFLSELRLGPGLQPVVNRIFVSITGIDLQESEKRLEDFRSIQELFTRSLVPGCRPVANSPVVSPADGKLLYSRAVHSKVMVQAKGLHYHLDDLTHGTAPCSMDQIGWCSIVYLAPTNYHRVHSPIDGTIRDIRYFPGQLWSVSPRMLKVIPNLYSSNERIVFEIEDAHGQLNYVVMVGALNVARMLSSLDEGILTQHAEGATTRTWTHLSGTKVTRGKELGIFLLGSTVICLFSNELVKTANMNSLSDHISIKMGEKL